MNPLNLVALTRAVSSEMANCELTHVSRVLIDVAVARAQHAAYEQALRELGCEVVQLPSDASMPDAVFIEDAAVVLDEIAVVTRPGAESRRCEVSAVADALERYRPVRRIDAPATIDGGDVIRIGRTLLVGRSTRTNAAGISQLSALAAPYGYTVRAVDVSGCLHLKSAATAVDDRTLLVDRSAIDGGQLAPFDLVDIDPSEQGAANVARVGGWVLAAAAFPRTRDRLEVRGSRVVGIDMSEMAKAEGAVTCCSLIFTV